MEAMDAGRKQFVRAILLLGLAHLLSLPVEGQTNGKLVTLEDAVRIALDRNPSLSAAKSDHRAAHWGVRKSYFNLLPRIDLGQSYTRLDQGAFQRASVFPAIGRGLIEFLRATNPETVEGVDPNDIRDAYRTMWGTNLEIVQPIYNGGAEWASIRLAEAQEDNQQWNVEATRQDVILGTQTAYLDALKARELVGLAQQTLEASQQHLSTVRKMFETGLRSRTEVLRWEVQVATDEANLIDAENQHELANAALIDVMGIDQRSGIQLADLELEPRPIRQSIEELSTLAEQHDPGLRSAEAGVESQRAGLKLAYSGFQPRINLLYNRSWEQNNTLAPDGFSTWNASVSISLPLFHSLREYASVRQARESVRSAEKLKERYRRSLSLRVKQAALNAQSAWKRLQVTQKAREEAEENLEVVNHLFEVGMAANIDVLDAQVATTTARSNAINVRYDYFSARAELERVVGVLDD